MANSNWGSGGGDFSFSFPDEQQPQQQQQFETFDYGKPASKSSPSPHSPQGPSAFYNPNPNGIDQNNPYGNQMPASAPYYLPPTSSQTLDTGAVGSDIGGSTGFEGNFEDEPPLLEELGINPYHIIEKTRSVLNPMRKTDANILQDTDLAGPVVFCVMFGFILLLTGKVHFNYIYGIGTISCIFVYVLLNMMSVAGVSIGVTVSVLGYCLLPMVGLAGFNLLLSLQGVVGTFLTILAVLWCSLSASKLFVTALNMEKQQPLVAYPLFILYGVFALLAVF